MSKEVDMPPLKFVPLYTKSKGRPCRYDFSPFKNAGYMALVIECVPTENLYNSIKSSFSRWRKRNNIPSGFVFDIYEDNITIWRRLPRENIITP
jgi:hypothetical protein